MTKLHRVRVKLNHDIIRLLTELHQGGTRSMRPWSRSGHTYSTYFSSAESALYEVHRHGELIRIQHVVMWSVNQVPAVQQIVSHTL